MTRDSTAFVRLANRFQQMVRDVHRRELSGVERFRVVATAPVLVLAQVPGDLQLVDGDPDFTVGETLRARVAAAQVTVGNLVWVARADGEWHAFDVVSR